MSELADRIAVLPTRMLELLVRWTRTHGHLDRRLETIPPRNRALPVPLSYAQERLWFLDQLQPGSVAYNFPLVLGFGDPLDAGLLERAINEIVARHESLRTTFAIAGGSPVQHIAPSLTIPLEELDLRGEPDAHARAELALRAEIARPFDLQRGPLLRALLIRRAPNDSLFVANMHHIVSDGWSSGVFTHELGALYAAFAQARPSPLEELPIQYADFAVWQREWLRGEALAQHAGYWKEQLAGAPPLLELPSDRPRPTVESARGAFQVFTIPARVAEPLRELARERGATPFMVLLAIFKALLARYAGTRDVVVGSPIANRNRAELEPLIGFFVNMLALRTELFGEQSVRALVDRVREVTLAAYEHQDLPFEKLVDELKPRRSLNHSPVYQVAFVLQNTPESEQSGPLAEVRELGFDEDPVVAAGSTKFDLTLSVAERGGGFVGTCEYRTDLFDHRTVARFLRRYVRMLDAAGRDPDQPLWQLPLVLPDEPAPARAALADRDACARAAAELLGIDAGSRVALLAADDETARTLARATAAVAGATPLELRADELTAGGATHAVVTPSLLSRLEHDAVPPGVTLIVAGWPCFDAALQRWKDRRVLGVWGPDAFSPCCAPLVFERHEAVLGPPFQGASLDVRDERLRCEAVDVWGVLYAGGSGAEPHSTGLVARRRGDGRIELAGTADRTVRIEGMRADPALLEALLAQHPLIAEAAVSVQGDGDGRWLAAWVVPRARKLGEDELVRYVAERLSAALVPRRIISCAALPRDDAERRLAQVHVVGSPRTPVEAVVARIWTELFKRPQLDVHANFFDEGGNSVTSVQVVARIRDALHVDLPLHRLFEAPTIAELAAAVEADPAFSAAGGVEFGGREAEPELRRTLSMLDVDTAGFTEDEILDLVDTLEDWEVDELLEQLVRQS